MIIAYSANDIPNDYLLCDGSEINRITYSKLFNIIGTIYGEGDKETTFNIPNLIDKFIQGGNITGTIKEAGLPNITGNIGYYTTGNKSIPNGALYVTEYVKGYLSSSNNGGSSDGIGIDASRSASIYGNSSTVQPPSQGVHVCIRYK